MSRSSPLLLVGSGGFGREVAQAVLGWADGPWRLVGFLDDDDSRWGKDVAGVQVLGPAADAADHPDAQLLVCTGRPGDYASRARLVTQLGLPEHRYATFVHPSCSLSPDTSVGPGTVILGGSTATAAVEVGAHVAVMPGVVLTHDDVVADFATLASRVTLGGGARVGRGAYLGAGALVREGCRIGDWSLVGMGSVVLRDVPAGEMWLGAPARPHGLAPEPARAQLNGPAVIDAAGAVHDGGES